MFNRLFAHKGVTIFIFVVLASLDNAATGILPPLYAIIAQDLAVSETALGVITAVYGLVVALSAVFWGYRGDQAGNRKQLMLYSTLLWSVALVLTGSADRYVWLFVGQVLTAVGVGGIASIGFSVVSDLIPPAKRGLALSLWSVSQAIGGTFGALLGSSLGAYDWRWPFWFVAGLGLLFAFLYRFVEEPLRGQAEPELNQLFEQGAIYEHRIQWADVRPIMQQASTRWLLIQGFLYSLAYSCSAIWIPRWAIARVQAEGYDLATSTIVGNLFVVLFGLGGFCAILAGWLGDRWQAKDKTIRPKLAGVALLLSIPFHTILYFIPFRGVTIPQTTNLLEIVWAVFASFFNNGWVFLAFGLAFLAVTFLTAEGPQWAAMITNVNLPEHRGTVIGLNRLGRAVAGSISVASASWLIGLLSLSYAEPNNYALGLAGYQLLVIPTALCYVIVAKHLEKDKNTVQQILTERGRVK